AGEARDQPADRDRGDRRDHQRPVAVAADPLAGILDLREAQAEGAGQLLAMRQQPRPAALAVEKRRAEPILEMPDLVADRRLGDEQRLGRPAERPGPGHRLEDAQGIERQVGHGTGPRGGLDFLTDCMKNGLLTIRPPNRDPFTGKRGLCSARDNRRRIMERERFQDYTGNGEPAKPTFSRSEMQRRVDAIRGHMAQAGIDAALFTSYHNVNYYSDFLYCYFGRRYGVVVTHD